MASEATLLARVGELRFRDLRAVYGASLKVMAGVGALVLDADGGLPVAAYVEFIDVRAGRGNHRAMRCPGCGGARSVLLARSATLACRACRGHRTRRQLEHRRADWTRRGGREEDELLRMFQPARRLTAARLDRARQLAAALVAEDEVRVSALQRRLDSFAAHLRCPS